jgi:hypothetical protein
MPVIHGQECFLGSPLFLDTKEIEMAAFVFVCVLLALTEVHRRELRLRRHNTSAARYRPPRERSGPH